MRKSWTIFKVSWQNSIEYRADFLAHLVLGLISLVVMTLIFRAVFSQGGTFAGYSFSTMFSYLVMTKILHFSTRGNTSRYIGDEIKEGKLSIFLIKPISYLKYWLSLFLADRLFEILIRFSFLTLFFIFFHKFFEIPSFLVTLFFILSLIIAVILNYLINIIIASFAFWTTDIRLFSSFLGLATGFLAGEVIPLDIFLIFLKNLVCFFLFNMEYSSLLKSTKIPLPCPKYLRGFSWQFSGLSL